MFRKDLEMKLFQNLKKDKQGFTLIEMIVVIVIIGILLAILVPGMFKYIERAKNKQIEVNARNAYITAQILIADEYSKKTPAYSAVTGDAIRDQSEVDGKIGMVFKDSNGKITSFKYCESGKVATLDIDNEVWSVSTDGVFTEDSISHS